MMELIAITILTGLLYIASIGWDIDNEALKNMIGILPLLPPTFSLWYNTPKNFLKFMCFKNIDIVYDLKIRFDDCVISEAEFILIREDLRKIYGSEARDRVISETIGAHIYASTIQVNAIVIDLQYSIEDGQLLIKSNNRMKYKSFFNLSKKIFSKIQTFFTSVKNQSFSKSIINLRIDFTENKSDDDCRNPFINRIFNGFNNKIVSFKYKTKNNTLVDIANHSINFYGENIELVNEDISKELTIFHHRN